MARDYRNSVQKDNKREDVKRSDAAGHSGRYGSDREARNPQQGSRENTRYTNERDRYRMNDLYERGSI